MQLTSEETIPSLLEKGVALKREGDGQAAIEIFRKILAAAPNHPQALHYLGILEFEQGRVSRGISLVQSAIGNDPMQAQFYVSLGNLFHRRRQPDKAIGCFNKAISLNPKMVSVLLDAGSVLFETGRTAEAERMLRRARITGAHSTKALMALSSAYINAGKLTDAADCLDEVLDLDPRCHQAYFYKGVIDQAQGRLDAALKAFGKAVEMNPGLAEAFLNMGVIHARLGNPDAAAHFYARALNAEPEMPEALNNMGNLQMAIGKPKAAVGWYKRAVERLPAYKDARLNLANAYRKSLDFQNAIDHYEHLLSETPDFKGGLIGLGSVYKDMRKPDEAIACFERVLHFDPNSIDAFDKLAIVYNDRGENEKARACLEKKAEIRPEFADKIRKAMMLPVIYDSVGMMDACRNVLERDLDRLEKEKRTIQDPHRQVGMTNFILALHGKDERPIRERIARFYTRVCPDLEWVSPWMKTWTPGTKIRLGMVSSFFNYTTIGNLYHGLIENISKEKFDLTLFRLPGKEDHLSKAMYAAADNVVHLPPDFRKAREIIAREMMDVIFYPELGMDPLTYFIAFSRLAPVQCKRGFQITMGIPAIDYFISSDAAEPDNGQQYYSEKLVRLKGTGYYYHRPEKPASMPERAAFGLPEDRNLYLCPQSLFKVHPDFDALIGEILKSDPRGDVVLLAGHYPQWQGKLLNRLERSIGSRVERIHFVPRLPRERFLQLYLVADAVIDTIHFSGGHTTLECFAWGIPVVTWPSAMLPGRLTYGFYRRMGVMDCVAWSAPAYVKIACRLANDPDWRLAIGRKIATNASVLFENKDDVRELEHFFEGAVLTHQAGQGLA